MIKENKAEISVQKTKNTPKRMRITELRAPSFQNTFGLVLYSEYFSRVILEALLSTQNVTNLNLTFTYSTTL